MSDNAAKDNRPMDDRYAEQLRDKIQAMDDRYAEQLRDKIQAMDLAGDALAAALATFLGADHQLIRMWDEAKRHGEVPPTDAR